MFHIFISRFFLISRYFFIFTSFSFFVFLFIYTTKRGKIDIEGVRLTHAKFQILEHQQNQKKHKYHSYKSLNLKVNLKCEFENNRPVNTVLFSVSISPHRCQSRPISRYVWMIFLTITNTPFYDLR